MRASPRPVTLPSRRADLALRRCAPMCSLPSGNQEGPNRSPGPSAPLWELAFEAVRLQMSLNNLGSSIPVDCSHREEVRWLTSADPENCVTKRPAASRVPQKVASRFQSGTPATLQARPGVDPMGCVQDDDPGMAGA